MKHFTVNQTVCASLDPVSATTVLQGGNGIAFNDQSDCKPSQAKFNP